MKIIDHCSFLAIDDHGLRIDYRTPSNDILKLPEYYSEVNLPKINCVTIFPEK